MLVGSILSLPYGLFEQEVVRPVLGTLAELLADSPRLYLLHWPKFSHLPPQSLPLEVVADGVLNACRKERNDTVLDEESLSLLIASAWIELNLSMYHFVEQVLRRLLGDDFQSVEIIDSNASQILVQELTAEFGSLKAFLFCILSSVRLEAMCFLRLREAAELEFASMQQEMQDLQKSCETLERKGKELSTPSPSSSSGRTGGVLSHSVTDSPAVRAFLSRSFDAVARPRSASTLSPPSLTPDGTPTLSGMADGSPVNQFYLAGRRKGWQMMSAQNLPPASGSRLQRRVQAGERRGWLEKLKKIDLVESTCTSPGAFGDDELRWKRRWVVVDAGKCLYFRGDEDSDPLGVIPLYLVSSIRTHPDLGPCAFGVRCGHLVNFIFRAPSVEEMTGWLFAIQQWLAKLRFGNETLIHSILAVPRWWKKLREKQSLERYTAAVERENAHSVIRNCVVNVDTVRPRPLVEDGGYPFVSACICSTQGHRPSMEDTHVACADLSSARKWDFESSGPYGSTAMFGVFDGHGGVEAATFVAEMLPQVLSQACPGLASLDLSTEKDRNVLRECLVQVFSTVDASFLEMATDALMEQPLLAGSTAVLVFLHSDRFITTANLGDSRAVLCRGGSALALSVDHKPHIAAERQRIEAAGGWVSESLELDVSRLWRLNPRLLDAKSIPHELAGSDEVGFVKVYRLNGELLVSRAFGDAECKGDLKNDFWEDRVFTEDVVSCEPDVITLERHVMDDEFIIIACDGLWDVFESQEAVQFLRARLLWHCEQAGSDRLVRSVEETPSGKKQSVLSGGLTVITAKATQDLVNEALTRGTQDNVSVICCLLQAPGNF